MCFVGHRLQPLETAKAAPVVSKPKLRLMRGVFDTRGKTTLDTEGRIWNTTDDVCN